MSFLRIFYFITAAIPLYYIGAVLFGAPFLSHFEDTFVFATVLTIFTVLPLVWSCGSGPYADKALCNLIFEAQFVNKRQLLAHRVAVGAIGGALCGAVVIPLDADLYWQKWPVPCIIGTIVGALLGAIFSKIELVFNRGKIIYNQSKLI